MKAVQLPAVVLKQLLIWGGMPITAFNFGITVNIVVRLGYQTAGDAETGLQFPPRPVACDSDFV